MNDTDRTRDNAFMRVSSATTPSETSHYADRRPGCHIAYRRRSLLNFPATHLPLRFVGLLLALVCSADAVLKAGR